MISKSPYKISKTTRDAYLGLDLSTHIKYSQIQLVTQSREPDCKEDTNLPVSPVQYLDRGNNIESRIIPRLADLLSFVQFIIIKGICSRNHHHFYIDKTISFIYMKITVSSIITL